MSEERFYNQVREQLFDYSPEVPQSVYGGMRRKLWWSDFTSFKAFRFNMWYLLIMVGGASAAVIYSTKENTDSIATKAGTLESRSWEPALANATAGAESVTTSCCASLEQTGTCASVSSSCSSANSANKRRGTKSRPTEILVPAEVAATPTVLIPLDVVNPNPKTEVEASDVSANSASEIQTSPAPAKAPTKKLRMTEYLDTKPKSDKKK